MRRVIALLRRELPGSALGALALAGLFIAISTLSAVAPRGTSSARSAPAPTPAASPTASPPGIVLASPDVRAVAPVGPTPTPAPAPAALGSAPEAGGIVFRACCESGRANGIWRYDGATGTIRAVGVSGEPTIDGRGYVVRTEDGIFQRVDARTGETVQLAPRGASTADAAPPGSDLLAAHADGVAWVTPRRGDPWIVARDLQVGTVRFSPDASRLGIVATSPDPERPRVRMPTELWVVDLPHGQPRLLVRLPRGDLGPLIQLGPWSPDGTLLAYWEISISNSMNADAVRLRAVDVRSGVTHDLGTTLSGASRLSWKAPHTLAYVSGGGRMTWEHKTVRIWSPEAGSADVTPAGTVGLNPSWSTDGSKLFLVTAEAHPYVPLDYFAGRDSGDRRLSVYGLATRTLAPLGRLFGYAYEGARASRDPSRLLVLWRATYSAPSLDALRPIPLTLGLLDVGTGRTTPLVRVSANGGFGYYGSYDGPEGMAWSEGR